MNGEVTRFTTANNAARKYHLEDAVHIFRAMLYLVKYDKDIVYANQVVNFFDYYPHLIQYLRKQFGYSEEVVECGLKIQSILQERLVVGGLTGKYKETSTIFVLKTIHQFNDQPTPKEEDKSVMKGIDWEKQSVDDIRKLKQLIQKMKGGTEQDGESAAFLEE